MAEDLDWQSIADSSSVLRAALSEELGGVVVEFKDGSQYLYQGADGAALAGLVMSPSPGSYVRRVLGGHPFQKI
jgi:KTSC domain